MESLSEKIEIYDKENDDNFVRVRDIKKAIKKLKNDIFSELNGVEAYAQGIQENTEKIINKVFGEQLVK